MRAMRRVPTPRHSYPAVSTAFCGRGARLPLPKTTERAILRPTTTGNPGNVGSILRRLTQWLGSKACLMKTSLTTFRF